MSPRFNAILIVSVVALVLLRMSVFTVDERDHALKFRFGEIVRADYQPGLHFKVPFVNNVVKYPNRILTYEHPDERFLTGEKKNLIVDYFVTWRIVDPKRLYEAVRGDEMLAIERLEAIVKEGIKAAISRRTVREVVSADRSELLDEMLVQARGRAPELGLSVVDVRVKRIELADEVMDSVFSRMRSERNRVAMELRAEGDEAYERIVADAERQRTVLLSEAYRDAERIRGEGDAVAAEIYAQAYNQDPEFYAFHRSMSAYRQAIGGDRDVLVLEPGSQFFQFLHQQLGSPAPLAMAPDSASAE
jgi:modulator of FtsH protease HflC